MPDDTKKLCRMSQHCRQVVKLKVHVMQLLNVLKSQQLIRDMKLMLRDRIFL